MRWRRRKKKALSHAKPSELEPAVGESPLDIFKKPEMGRYAYKPGVNQHTGARPLPSDSSFSSQEKEMQMQLKKDPKLMMSLMKILGLNNK